MDTTVYSAEEFAWRGAESVNDAGRLTDMLLAMAEGRVQWASTEYYSQFDQDTQPHLFIASICQMAGQPQDAANPRRVIVAYTYKALANSATGTIGQAKNQERVYLDYAAAERITLENAYATLTELQTLTSSVPPSDAARTAVSDRVTISKGQDGDAPPEYVPIVSPPPTTQYHFGVADGQTDSDGKIQVATDLLTLGYGSLVLGADGGMVTINCPGGGGAQLADVDCQLENDREYRLLRFALHLQGLTPADLIAAVLNAMDETDPPIDDYRLQWQAIPPK